MTELGLSATGDPRPAVVVFTAHAIDPAGWAERYRLGEVIDQMPYGYDQAAPWMEVRWTQSHREGRLARKVRHALLSRLGFDLIHAWRNRRALDDTDVIWAHTEREHLAVAALQLLRRRDRRTPIVAQSVWLWDEWASWSMSRRWLTRRLLRRHAAEFVLSPANRLAAAATVPDREVVFLPFGSAPVTTTAGDSSKASADSRTGVVVVGSDVHRDWETLAAAAAMLPQIPFRVASRSARVRQVEWPDNVTLAPTASREELAALYAGATAIVVPLRPNLHASGVTTCIESLGSAPLIVTDVGGLRDYLPNEATFVPEGDPRALTLAISAAANGQLTAPSPESIVDRGLTQRDYVLRFVHITRAMLAGESAPVFVSEFAPVPPP